MRSITRLIVPVVLSLFLIPVGLRAQEPRTGAERVEFERTTSHDELIEFLFDVQSQTNHMLIQELGVTNEGRMIPLVILGAPPSSTPGTAWFSGKPTVFFTGSVHGNERAGKEGSQQLIRELALGELSYLLDEVNVLIVPSLNPDGAEAPSRTNSLGYDMNRDFVVVETPEISGIIEGVLTEWWPDIYVDVHNGGAYPYNITYQATLHPAAEQDLVAFARGPLYDGVTQHLEEQEMMMYWYSGPRRDQTSGEWSWGTTEPWVRKQHTYGGLQNVITLLFEIPGRWTLGEQAANAREAMEGLLKFVAENPQDVRETVMEARRKTIQEPPAEVVITFEESAYPDPEEFYAIERRDDGSFGEPMLVEGMNRTLFVPAETRSQPWAYVFDGRLDEVATQLGRHGIEVEQLLEAVTVPVEQYKLLSSDWADSPYQGHLLTQVEVEVVPGRVELPSGTYVVRTAQNAGRLLTHLMEPDTEDSLVRWNFIDYALSGGRGFGAQRDVFLPIHRVMAPVGMRSVVVK